MTSRRGNEDALSGSTVPSQERRIELGDQVCPRCRKSFTMSYWNGETLVQARCLSCDLKWPRPDVV